MWLLKCKFAAFALCCRACVCAHHFKLLLFTLWLNVCLAFKFYFALDVLKPKKNLRLCLWCCKVLWNRLLFCILECVKFLRISAETKKKLYCPYFNKPVATRNSVNNLIFIHNFKVQRKNLLLLILYDAKRINNEIFLLLILNAIQQKWW